MEERNKQCRSEEVKGGIEGGEQEGTSSKSSLIPPISLAVEEQQGS